MRFPATATILASSVAASAIPHPRAASSGVTFSTTKAIASRNATSFSVSPHTLTLTKTGRSGNSAARLLGLTPGSRAAAADIATSNHSSTLLSLFEGEEFATSITFGTQTVESIVDTGSSDTWVVETGFSCINLETGKSTTEAECEFGPTYTVTDAFTQIPNEIFEIEYGDGEYLSGVVGTETVTLAGITLTQEVAIVNSAAWEGDGTTSGLIGLAYPALTSAYSSKTEAQEVYNPIFTTMVNDGLVSSLFSLAILRDVSGDAGYLSLGGVPPIDFTQNFTTTPILVTSISGYPKGYDFYTINIDDVYLNSKAVSGSGGTSLQYIVDSGTTLNYFPTSVANAINAAFSPAAVYSDDYGAYVVDCDATTPTLTIEIGGVQLGINSLDLILDAGTDDDGNELCISGIDDGGSGSEALYILGDTFFKNVVAVFDVGAGELSFAGREYYDSNDTY